METYTSLYQGETRALTIYVRDQNDDDFEPTSASTYIKDSSDNIIVNEISSLVSGASITALVDNCVTSAAGNYKVIWKILNSGYIYYHITKLEIESI